MSIKSRLAKLEESAGISKHSVKQVILLADTDGFGSTATIERRKAENEPVAKNTDFIVLVAME